MKIGDVHEVANGLDRGHVDIVADVVNMPTRDVLAFQVLLLLKATPRWNTISGIQQHSSSKMQTSKYYHGHDQVITVQQASRPACWTPRTIQYIIHAAAVVNSTCRNTVDIFSLHYDYSIIFTSS